MECKFRKYLDEWHRKYPNEKRYCHLYLDFKDIYDCENCKYKPRRGEYWEV